MVNQKLTLQMLNHREKIENIKEKIYQTILDEEIYYIHLGLNEITQELKELYNLYKIK